METLYKPIPIVFNNTLGLIQNYTNSFIAVAGTDIDLDSKVYLLYEIPISLLARRFNCFTGKNDNKLNILVSWNILVYFYFNCFVLRKLSRTKGFILI